MKNVQRSQVDVYFALRFLTSRAFRPKRDTVRPELREPALASPVLRFGGGAGTAALLGVTSLLCQRQLPAADLPTRVRAVSGNCPDIFDVQYIKIAQCVFC